jgi:hypothetical protein
MHTYGDNTITKILHSENHKTGVELVADAAIKKGEPCKLTDDGLATPWAKTDLARTFVGIAQWDAAEGEMITLHSRGYMILHAVSAAATVSGYRYIHGYDKGRYCYCCNRCHNPRCCRNRRPNRMVA